MSIEFYRMLNQVFGLMVIGVIFGIMSFAATLEIKDLDLWLHMRAGEYVVTHGYVPVEDVLSVTGQGLHWNNHEWLFQVVLYLVKSSFGMDALLYLQSGLVVLTCLILLFIGYQRNRQMVVAGLMYFVFLIFQTRFTVRPDIFSLLFYAGFLYVLSMHMAARWSLAALFVMQLLWVNMHGYFFLGILFVLMALGAETIKRRVPLPWEWNKEGRLTDEEFKRLKVSFFVVCMASAINPQGLAGALYPLNIFHQMCGDSKVFLDSITELARPITRATLFDWNSLWPLKSLIIISGLSFVLNRRRVDVSALLLWFFFLVFGLTALRNMVYLAFACYLTTLVNLSNVDISACLPFKPVHKKFVYITGILVRIFFTVYLLDRGIALSKEGYYDFEKYERKSNFLGIDQNAFPQHAADFLANNQIKGRFFNDFNSGAYLIGRLYPNILVYMDGRTELRGPKFFENYKKIWEEGNLAAFDEAVSRYRLTGVFVNTATASAPEDFLKMLTGKKEWKIVYFDYDAIVFLRDIPENSEIIKKFDIDLSFWKPKRMDLKKFGPCRAMPYSYVSRGYSLYSMGYFDQALAEADAMLEVSPDQAGAYKIISRVYEDRKDYNKMFLASRLSVVFAPADVRLRSRLAYAYLKTGDDEHALIEADKMIEQYPDSGRGEMTKAKVFTKKKQFKEGYDILLLAFKKDSGLIREALEVGDIAFEDKEYDQAEKIFRLIASKDKKGFRAVEKLGDVLAAMGRKQDALAEWRRAFDINPAGQELGKKIQQAGG